MEVLWPLDGDSSESPIAVPTDSTVDTTTVPTGAESFSALSTVTDAVGVGTMLFGAVGFIALFLFITAVVLPRKKKPAGPVLDPKKDFTPAEKAQVLREAHNKCEYCGRRIGSGKATLSFRRTYVCDHIVPHAKGGRTVLANAAASCSECKALKGAKSFDEFAATYEKALIYRPNRPRGHGPK